MKACKQNLLMALAICFLCASSAPALTIDTHFIGGDAPANVAGQGNLHDIVRAAARMWESVYAEPITLTLYYGWADTGNAGTHALSTQGGAPNRETSGTILFDNTGAASFYLDPTPYQNEEYRTLTEQSQDLGGGYINVARVFSNPIGEVAGHLDLLSVVLHEIGHALGMSAANVSFIAQSETGILAITNELPYQGSMIPLAYNNAGVVAHFSVDAIAYGSLMAGINAEERRIPSELDILANAQISGFSILRLRPDQNPPSGDEDRNTRGIARNPDSRGISASGRPVSVGRSRGTKELLLSRQLQLDETAE
jgi:hypothetical protein